MIKSQHYSTPVPRGLPCAAGLGRSVLLPWRAWEQQAKTVPANSCFPSSDWRGLGGDAEKTLNVSGRKMKAAGTREKTLEGEGGERKRGGGDWRQSAFHTI